MCKAETDLETLQEKELSSIWVSFQNKNAQQWSLRFVDLLSYTISIIINTHCIIMC